MPDENVTEGLSGSKDGEAARQKMQIKSFTAWVNLHLKQAGMAVENLKTDFGDGIKLLRLVEIISEEELGKYNQNPVSKFQKVENLNIPLKCGRAPPSPPPSTSAVSPVLFRRAHNASARRTERHAAVRCSGRRRSWRGSFPRRLPLPPSSPESGQ